MGLTIKLALRNIFRNTRRTFLTTLLIGSGLGTLMFTDGLMIGMSDMLIRKVTDTWLGEAQIHHPEFRKDMDAAFYISDPSSAMTALEQAEGVLAFAPRTLAIGMVASSNNVSGGAIYGIDPDREDGVSTLRESLIEGSFLEQGSQKDILIGHKMADLLEAELGDRIVVTLSEPVSGEISQALFRVSGYLDFGDRAMDSGMAFVSLEAGQKMLGLGQGIHEIAIRLDPAIDHAALLEDLRSTINAPDIELLGWYELMPEIAGILESQGFGLWIMGAILFILVSLGLINSMFMSIYERHYEFGVMLGLGTRSRKLFALICWEGALIGVLGAIIGLALGTAVNYWASTSGIMFGSGGSEFSGVTINEPIKTAFSIQQYTALPIFIVILSALACIVPAIHGARLQPADAMRRAL